jgi:hypothetical protein
MTRVAVAAIANLRRLLRRRGGGGDGGAREEGEQVCAIALTDTSSGDRIRSARCVRYLREFSKHLPTSASGAVAEFREQAMNSRLWRLAARSNT